jgi:hypothetical protein
MNTFEVKGYTIQPFKDGRYVRHDVLIDSRTIRIKSHYTQELLQQIESLFPNDKFPKMIINDFIENDLRELKLID